MSEDLQEARQDIEKLQASNSEASEHKASSSAPDSQRNGSNDSEINKQLGELSGRMQALEDSITEHGSGLELVREDVSAMEETATMVNALTC